MVDIKKHIKDISEKYLIAGETADGAVMFLPAEAIAMMDEAGVDGAVIHPPGWDPASTEIALKAVQDYPGRFTVMGSVPLEPASLIEISSKDRLEVVEVDPAGKANVSITYKALEMEMGIDAPGQSVNASYDSKTGRAEPVELKILDKMMGKSISMSVNPDGSNSNPSLYRTSTP